MARKKGIEGTLNVSGEGQVKAAPDLASVRLAVLTEGKTADEASSKNAEITTQMIERLGAIGVPRDAMKTIGLNLYPIFQVDEKTGDNRITGYRAENSVAVELPIKLAGRVFDAGIQAGANESSGISFSLKDERPLRDKAIEEAIAAAEAEADVVARAMRLSIDGPRTIDVDQGGGPIVMRASFAESRVATPVLPGEITVSARVRIAFAVHG